MTLRPLRWWLTQLHWLLGITAGTVLVLVGLTGALMALRAEIVEALHPQLFQRAAPTPQAQPLAPAELVARLQAAGSARVQTLTLHAAPGRPVRVGFAPAPGARRGAQHWADPWTAELLPEPRADALFEPVEELHRWLLLPREAGKLVTGTLAAALLLLALSGLVLRWPRRPLDWRAWLRLDWRLRGRAFLWNLHAVAGTLALLCYLVSGLTGVYWGFAVVRTAIDAAAGEGQAARAERTGRGADAAAAAAAQPPDLGRLWQGFLQASGGDWSQVTLRLPARAAPRVELTYLRAVPEHDRARNRLYLDAATGAAAEHRRYAELPVANRLLNSVYPLHTGSYWGWPGRVAMALAAAALALFAVTGWLLYLDRRRAQAAVRAERRRLGPGPTGGADGGADGEGVLVAYASQTGRAERIAWQTAAALREAGLAAQVRSLAALAPAELLRHPRLLLVASSFGEGEPPDAVRGFAQRLAQLAAPLQAGPAYGLLALGNQQYPAFCGFGRALDGQLRRLGAQALFAPVEMDDGDAGALARWRQSVGTAFGRVLGGLAMADEAPWLAATLADRRLLNAGSQGGPLVEVALALPPGTHWAPGALAEVLVADGSAPRSYSVASLPADGPLQLLVRQQQRADGSLGLASGWLTQAAPLGAQVRLCLLVNPGFALVEDARPCIFIGNGSGYAGLRAHLRERVRRGHGRNWLLYGERQAAHDAFVRHDLQAWQAAGLLARADLAYSRDGAGGPRYVQDSLRAAAGLLRQWVDEGAVLYVCGSLAGMAQGVDEALREVLGAAVPQALAAAGRYRRDVY
ncbi:sulfite reductase flavoprotein subunit alpha [Pseudorhodoferax sp. LjRoot39]|uniref:PepSY domain-containing protein n=1 Tax=Pseudorhodoferax sp. LjRoot39 TaxID=3342328 RepID=UPI003ED0D75E